ncbi:hypothetical protein [Roseiarcus fermentans]|uniref:hypothetical protein n=1 Tax=Roseiarcus fermentans TaxID=1473586 RepID=UPI0011BFBD61|nr:hypothetical protein [Roseiarcus fermentans]
MVVRGQTARLEVLIETARAHGADLLIHDAAPNADQTALRAARDADPPPGRSLRPRSDTGDADPRSAGEEAALHRPERNLAAAAGVRSEGPGQAEARLEWRRRLRQLVTVTIIALSCLCVLTSMSRPFFAA